jgi:indole-3-glycerol phosphate synthase
MASRGAAREGAGVSERDTPASSEGILASIVARKRDEVRRLVPREPTDAVGPRRNVASSLRRAMGQPLRLIAENKRRSPSAGPLSTKLETAERVVRYAEAGAAMVSVLCDAPFFDGSWNDVLLARRALVARGHHIPLLAKEFILDERQLREARACGADAVLLIARIVDAPTLRALLAAASDLGLESLVEVATEVELGWAVDAGATIIGVNARDLDRLVMDPERAARVLEAIPASSVAVYLSGVKGPDDVLRIAKTRADAALIGETLMRQDEPEALLGTLVATAAARTET